MNSLMLRTLLALTLALAPALAPAQVIYGGINDASNPNRPPSSSVGTDNSWYIDFLSGNVFGPKLLGQWPQSPSSSIRGTGSPGGLPNQIQLNAAGSFGGWANSSVDPVTGQLTLSYTSNGNSGINNLFVTQTINDPTAEVRPTTFLTVEKLTAPSQFSVFGISANVNVDPGLYTSTVFAHHTAAVLGIASMFNSVSWVQGCTPGVSCPGLVEAINGGEFEATLISAGELQEARDVLLHRPSYGFSQASGGVIDEWFGIRADGCFSSQNAAMCYLIGEAFNANYSGFGTLTPIANVESWGKDFTSTATGIINNGVVCLSTTAAHDGAYGILPYATVTSAHITGTVHILSAAPADIPNGMLCYTTDDTAQTYLTPETLTFNNTFRGFLSANNTVDGEAGYYYTIATGAQRISAGMAMRHDDTFGNFWALSIASASGVLTDSVYGRTQAAIPVGDKILAQKQGLNVGYTSLGSVPILDNAYSLAVGRYGVISDGGFAGGGDPPSVIGGSCGGTVTFATDSSNTVGSFTLSGACTTPGGSLGFTFNRIATGWTCQVTNTTAPARTLTESVYGLQTARFIGNTNAGDSFLYQCMSFGTQTF